VELYIVDIRVTVPIYFCASACKNGIYSICRSARQNFLFKSIPYNNPTSSRPKVYEENRTWTWRI